MNHRTPLFCQRWRDHRSSYRPAGEVINPNDFDVAPISMSEAKQFVISTHYSRSYCACRFRYGLFSHTITKNHWHQNGLTPELVGVAVFSMPMSTKTLTNIFPGDPRDSVELGRFVLLDEVKANAESFFFTRCKTLLKREGLRGIVAFADSTPRSDIYGNICAPGHLGTVYQSTMAAYLLRSAPRTLRILPNGTVLSPRAISKIKTRQRGWRYASQILVAAGATAPKQDEDLSKWLDQWIPQLTRPLRHPGNHRYAWQLSNTAVPVGTPQPYPKNFATAAEMLKLKEKAANLQTGINPAKRMAS